MRNKHLTCILNKSVLSQRAAFGTDVSILFKKVASLSFRNVCLKVTKNFIPRYQSVDKLIYAKTTIHSNLPLFLSLTDIHTYPILRQKTIEYTVTLPWPTDAMT